MSTLSTVVLRPDIERTLPSWTESIAQKVKRRKKVEDTSRKEIWHSVFAPQIEPVFVEDDVLVRLHTQCAPSTPNAAPQVKTLDHKPQMTKEDFRM